MFILELLLFVFVFLPVIPAGYHWEKKKTSAQVFMLGKTCVALWVFTFTEEPSIASYVYRLMRRFNLCAGEKVRSPLCF
jgi:hypothetical protein